MSSLSLEHYTYITNEPNVRQDFHCCVEYKYQIKTDKHLGGNSDERNDWLVEQFFTKYSDVEPSISSCSLLFLNKFNLKLKIYNKTTNTGGIYHEEQRICRNS